MLMKLSWPWVFRLLDAGRMGFANSTGYLTLYLPDAHVQYAYLRCAKGELHKVHMRLLNVDLRGISQKLHQMHSCYLY